MINDYLFSQTNTQAEIEQNILSRLQAAGINIEPGTGIARILAESIASEITTLKDITAKEMTKYSLSDATGEDLESLTEKLFGINRLGATKANCTFSSQIIELENTTNAAIVVPRRTKISSSEVNAIYYTREEYTVLSGGKTLISVEAEDFGSDYNVSSRVLNRCDIAGVNVNQYEAIVNGRDAETDASLRSRASRHIERANRANQEKLDLEVLSNPESYNIKIYPGYFGNNTAGILPYYGNTQNSTMLSTVENIISSFGTRGERYKVIEASFVKFIFVVENKDSGEITALTNSIKASFWNDLEKIPYTQIDFNNDALNDVKRIIVVKDDIEVDEIQVNSTYNIGDIELIKSFSIESVVA